MELALLLQKLGQEGPVEMPDLQSKEELQAYVGIDIDQARIEKGRFIEEILPRWLEEGREREAKMEVQRVHTQAR
jgi:nitrite reductase (cytochrome c-552)